MKSIYRLSSFVFVAVFLCSSALAETVVDPKYDVRSCGWTNSRTVVVGNIYTHTEDYRCVRVRDRLNILTAIGTKTIDLTTQNDYVCKVNPMSPYKWSNSIPNGCFTGKLVEPTITISTPTSCGANAGRVFDSYVLPSEMNTRYPAARNFCASCSVEVKFVYSGYNNNYYSLSCGK